MCSSSTGGAPLSPSGKFATGTRYVPDAHAPRSISRQRSEQNGRQRDAGVHSTGVPQCGQATMRGDAIELAIAKWALDAVRRVDEA